MLIDYVSSAMDETDFKELFQNSPQMPGQQAQKYNRLMIRGLAKNGVAVHAVSGRPITNRNCSKKYIKKASTKKDNILWLYVPIINLPIIKNIWQILTAFTTILLESKKKDNAVVLDVLNASISYGASVAAKMTHRPCIGIVTDMPELMVTGSGRNQVKLINRVIKNCTGYVFITEDMNDAINVTKAPYVIIEGLCESRMKEPRTEKHTASKCIYAGLLDARYGVKTMVEGFIHANIPDAELHIYGDGPYKEELVETAKKHEQIKFHGSVLNEEIVKAESEADLLINPRPTWEKFTKYSFPSKNMEYMASGTPVLTTKLPGMPEEYLNYVFLFEDESTNGMADALKKIFALPQKQRNEKGIQAQRFVLEKKNNLIQTKKILSLLK